MNISNYERGLRGIALKNTTGNEVRCSWCLNRTINPSGFYDLFCSVPCWRVYWRFTELRRKFIEKYSPRFETWKKCRDFVDQITHEKCEREYD